MDSIKVVGLVPTRGDRPKFLDNMHRMMRAQTKQLHGLIIVDDIPVDPFKKDLTYRYRVGLQRVFDAYPDTDVVALIEDDDWYSPNYIRHMSEWWHKGGRPHIFGLSDTYYYHLGIKAWNHQSHPGRASAFSTFITKAVLDNMRWPVDDYLWTDIEFWNQFKSYGQTIPNTSSELAIGIKHGMGITGGIGHNPKWVGYKHRDPEMEWLKSKVDVESFKFYSTLF